MVRLASPSAKVARMRIAPPQVSQTRTSVANTRFRREAQSSRRRDAGRGGRWRQSRLQERWRREDDDLGANTPERRWRAAGFGYRPDRRVRGYRERAAVP